MTNLAGLTEQVSGWEAPTTKPLDEAVWHRWIAKNVNQDRRRIFARIALVNWIALFVLVIAVVAWYPLAPFDVAIRFAIAAGAIVLLFQAISEQEYIVAAVFAAVAVIFNPVAPVVDFAGSWQRIVAAASALPFVASLARMRRERTAAVDNYD